MTDLEKIGEQLRTQDGDELMPHISKKTSAERVRGESPVCGCGRRAVKKHCSVWSCQRCIDWDAVIPGTDKTRAISGKRDTRKRGEL